MSENNFSDILVDEYDIFAKITPRHDELQNSIALSLKKYFKRKQDLVFVDIGCGFGFTTKFVHKKFPQAKFILNDISENLLKYAKKYLKGVDFKSNNEDIEVFLSKLPNNSVDAVYTAWVLHNFPIAKRANIFREVQRVLKSGGVFVYLEKIGNKNLQREKDLSQTFVNFTPIYKKYKRPDLYLEWIRHYLRDETECLLFSDTENEVLLKKNNFTFKCVKHVLFEKTIFAVKK